jgi:hypothetical protein
LGVNERSSGGAEKSGEGMAFKIFTGAKPFLKVYMKPFDITEIRMLTPQIRDLNGNKCHDINDGGVRGDHVPSTFAWPEVRKAIETLIQ